MTFFKKAGVLVFVTCCTIAFRPGGLSAQKIVGKNLAGRVLSAETNEPLQAANVFIANSILGAATDNTGAFVIRGVRMSSFELVVSMIGYEIYKRKITMTGEELKPLLIRLKPKVLQGQEIVVTAKAMKEWKKQLKKFNKLFFSNTENAKGCKILNPEMLDFDTTKPRVFRATAQAPLEIENRALGYKLYYVLEQFEASKDFLVYAGVAKFEELEPESPREAKKWQANRLYTYKGSMRHFLSELVRNYKITGGSLDDNDLTFDKQPLNEAGFYAFLLKFLDPEIPEQRGDIVNTNRLLEPGDTEFERKLVFQNFLKVVYTRELEEDGYLEYVKDVLRDPGQQVSWIRLPYGSLSFDTNNYTFDPFKVETYGYWAWQRVADMLPAEYQAP